MTNKGLYVVVFLVGLFTADLFSRSGWSASRLLSWVTPPVEHVVLPPPAEAVSQPVRRIQVLTGDTFDITLRDDTRFLGKLPVPVVESAKAAVLDFLNHGTNPRVVFQERRPDGRWTVDLFVTKDGREVSLRDWLAVNKMVLR